MFTLSTDPSSNGFSMKFPNGYVVSVRWGHKNYCSNMYMSDSGATISCLNAEVGIIDPHGNFVGNDVQGYVDPAMVLDLMNKAANL